MATQEQDDFAEAFGEDVQRSEMSEDEAFGLAPEADLETPDEAEAEMAEEPVAEESAAEPAIAESAPNDPAPAETGEAGPVEETSVVVEPGAADAGDVEVMSPEDIQREKSWMGRLKAKEAELKAREEALKGAAPVETPAEEEAPAAEAMESAMEKVESGELTFEQAMQTLESDFGPDFPKMLSVIAKHIGSQVSDERVGSVRGELDEVVNELRNDKEKSHYETISEAHPDFMDVGASPEFRAYVEGLPGSEQERAMQVINGGTAKQINKLLSDYKAKGQVTTEADIAPAAPAADPVDESALDAAEGVRSAGLKIPEKPAQADDYEAAWNEF